MRANRGLALVMLMVMSWGTVATAEEIGYAFAGPGESSDPVERLVQQLVEGVCGDDDACRGALERMDEQDACGSAPAQTAANLSNEQKAAYLRQLGAYYVVTAFTQLGAARIPDSGADKEGREALANGLLRRVFEARRFLETDFSANSTAGINRAARYQLARADAIIAVADVVAAGSKPSLTRINALIKNPLGLRNEAGNLIRDALKDAVYADSYRGSFRAVVKDLSKANCDQFMAKFDIAWKAMGERLAGYCGNLKEGGGSQGECDVLKESLPAAQGDDR